MPTIEASYSFNHNVDDSVGFFGAGTKVNQDVYSLEMSLPIYQGGFKTARAREARARFRQATRQLENQNRAVARDVRNLYRSVTTDVIRVKARFCLLYTSPSPRDATLSRMPSSA